MVPNLGYKWGSIRLDHYLYNCLGNIKIMTRLFLSSTTGAKALDAEWFTTDISPKKGQQEVNEISISLSTSTPTLVEISFNSGTDWELLFEVADQVANKLIHTKVDVEQGDLINFRSNTAGGTTVNRCVVSGVL